MHFMKATTGCSTCSPPRVTWSGRRAAAFAVRPRSKKSGARMKRCILAALIATALGVRTPAQGGAGKSLPLDNLGLEHLDIVVPDPAASARFYARIFRSALHQQPVRDTLRYFVLLGDL